MKTLNWLAVIVAVLALTVKPGYAQTPEVATGPDNGPVTAPATLSPAAAEVVQLATSGVGQEVVLAYIQNSQVPFNLSADDLVYLKDVGLSPEVTAAMIKHDNALRAEPQQYAPVATNPPPAAQPAPAPDQTVAVAPEPVYVTSPPPDVTYFYSDLAPYGSWVQLDGYGWCWQPTAVILTPGWRPYCDGGYWVYSDLGWYWQSSYSWGWAPFHYGRWHRHARCGWVWLPDRVWGPAWVTWRSYGDTCGWAPLPPHATFNVRLGWCYKGVVVGANFGFNLGSDAFLFVGFGNLCSHNLRPHCLPHARAASVYRHTTIINNYAVVNNRVVHRGIPVEHVASASHATVPRATVRDWPSRPSRMPARSGPVVYRAGLKAPTRPVHMEAQRVDNQHPVIQHTRVASFRAEPRATASSGVAFGSRTSRPDLTREVAPSSRSSQTPRWSGGSQLQSSPQARPGVTAPSVAATPQSPSTAPAGRGSPGSTRSREARSTQSAPATSPASRWSSAPDNWKQGAHNAPGYRSDVGLPSLNNARAAQSPPTVSPAPNPHVYYPKGYYQNSELQSSRPTGNPTPGPSAPRGNRFGSSGRGR